MYLIRCEFEFPKTDDRLKHDTQNKIELLTVKMYL